MNRSVMSPSLVVLCVLGMATMACSSPKNSSNSMPDGGVVDATGSPDAPGDILPPPDGTITLDTGMNFFLHGVTNDGYAIYRTPTAVMAVSVAGGTPIKLVDLTPSIAVVPGDVRVFGNFAFIWKDVGHTLGVGTLWVWSHTATQVATNSVDTLGAASADSSAVLFSGDAPTGNSGSLYGATVATLASPTQLATNTYLRGDDCDAPWLYFTGTATPHAVIGYCAFPVSATKQSVVSFPTTTWAAHTLGTNIAFPRPLAPALATTC